MQSQPTTPKDIVASLHQTSGGSSVSPKDIVYNLINNIHPSLDTQQNLPADTMNHIMFKESSSGKNDANRLNDSGKYGWLYGITNGLYNDKQRLGLQGDTNTPEGAAQFSANYAGHLNQAFHGITTKEEIHRAYNLGETGYFYDTVGRSRLGENYIYPATK